MKNIGIIGAGSIARAHATAINHSKSAALMKVYDLSFEHCKKFTDEFGGLPCESVDDLLDAVDIVVIATPNFSHYHYCALSIIRNLPVLCEKPLACSLKEAETMLGMASISNRMHSISLNYRYLPVMDVLKRKIESKTLGDVISIKLEFLKNSALRKKKISWRDLNDSNQTSGSFGDLGSHLIDSVFYLTGEKIKPGTIRAMTKTVVSSKGGSSVEVDDNAYVCCTLNNGCFVEIRTSKTDISENQGFNITALGSKEDISYHTKDKCTYKVRKNYKWEPHTIAVENKIADPENEIFGWSDTFLHQLDDFCDDNSYKVANFKDGYEVQKFIDEVITLTTKENSSTVPDNTIKEKFASELLTA